MVVNGKRMQARGQTFWKRCLCMPSSATFPVENNIIQQVLYTCNNYNIAPCSSPQHNLISCFKLHWVRLLDTCTCKDDIYFPKNYWDVILFP